MSTLLSLRRRSALLILLSLLLVVSGCVGGTGPAGSDQGPVARPAATPPDFQGTPWPTPTRAVPAEIRLAAGAPGSAYESFGKAIAAVWMARVPGLKVTVLITDGPADNLRLLDRGAADVALTRDDLSVQAANMRESFGNVGHKIQAAAIAALYQEAVQIIAGADTNIEATRNLVGRRVSVPPPDSAANLTLWQVLRQGNFRVTDFREIAQLSDANAAAAFRDKRIDVIMTTAPGPVPAIQEAAQARPVRLVPIPVEYRELVQQRYGFLYDTVIPAGSYPGQEAPVETLGARGILVVRRDLAVDHAYVLAKALVEGRDELAASHPLGKEFDPRQITQRLSTPFHVGATEYFREAGLAK